MRQTRTNEVAHLVLIEHDVEIGAGQVRDALIAGGDVAGQIAIIHVNLVSTRSSLMLVTSSRKAIQAVSSAPMPVGEGEGLPPPPPLHDAINAPDESANIFKRLSVFIVRCPRNDYSASDALMATLSHRRIDEETV